MKKTLTIIALLAGATGVYAQGTVELGDYVGGGAPFGITIWSPQLATPTVETQGQWANDLNAGATVYTGVPLGGAATGSGPTAYGNGSLWTLAVFAAPGVGNAAGVTAAEAAGTPVFTSLFFTSGGVGSANAGTQGNDTAGAWVKNYQVPTASTLALFPGGATFQLAAWYNGSGLTLAEAEVTPQIPWGLSTEGSIASLGNNGSPPATVTTLGGASPAITSFSLQEVVPEPSTIALGVMGASALLFRRRK
jgi:hypothetical protein